MQNGLWLLCKFRICFVRRCQKAGIEEGRKKDREEFKCVTSPLHECGLAGANINLALHKHGRAVYVPAVALAWRNFSARGTGQE